MDDYEVPVSDTPDFDLSDTTEFFEAELIELEDDVSNEVPHQEGRTSFQEPEFSESGSEGDVGAGVEVNPTEELGSDEIYSDLSEGEKVVVPVYDETTVENPQEEINTQSERKGSEQSPGEKEFVSETTHEQVSVGEEIDPETTNDQEPERDVTVPETTFDYVLEGDYPFTESPSEEVSDENEQVPEVEEIEIETSPEQVSEDNHPDPKTAPDTIHAEDEVRTEELEPNVVYERNGYEYKTDDLGRTQLVSGDLDLTKGFRTPLQTERGHMGLDGDEGGHLIGTRFNGPTDAFNLVPQDANLNRGEWKAMENSWANGLSNGQDVKVMVEPVYGDDSIRPKSFEVISQVDGELTYTSFLNQPSIETKGEKNG